LDYIIQICLALQHIQKKKILHRNLKSGNVFLMKSGLVKLGYFIISKGLKATWEKRDIMVGAPYLSPEILNGKLYDSKSDIWALGILLYELMTFKMPFNAVSLPLFSIKINRGVYQPPPDTYSSEIRDLLKKCLTLDPEERPSIDDILQLPLIKNRINNFLNEVQYDQDLFKTMAKKYKDKKKEKRHNQDSNKNTNETTHANNDEKKETKKMVSGPNKARELLKKKKEGKKKEENKLSNTITDKKSSDNISLGDNTKTNFLIQKKDPNFKQDKVYKEDEIGKTLKEKGYKDLLNEKNGNFDVNKMNEDQYNQLTLLNNLHNVANDLAQDSDSEISVSSSVSSIPGSKSEDISVEDINLDMPKEKEQVKPEISKEAMERLKEENKEIENIKKEIEKEIGNDLFKEIINIMEKSCDKTEIKFDRQLISKNIKDLSNKGFDKAKIEKAEERMDEIFAVLMKDKILV